MIRNRRKEAGSFCVQRDPEPIASCRSRAAARRSLRWRKVLCACQAIRMLKEIRGLPASIRAGRRGSEGENAPC
ncbi:hypothetical protein B6K89_00015 [Bacillus subtilis]|nr:hypothetical protein B6K89_00015 [Bacillus subtilis]